MVLIVVSMEVCECLAWWRVFDLVTSVDLERDKAGRGEVTRNPLQQHGGLDSMDLLCSGLLAR